MQNDNLYDMLGVSEEVLKKIIENYTERPECIKNMKMIRRKHRIKKIYKSLRSWFKNNFWNITTLVIGVVTLIFSVLGYLKE